MRTAARRCALALLMAAGLAGCAAGSAGEGGGDDAARLRQAAARILFWPQDVRQANFMAMDDHFPGHVVPGSGRMVKWATGPEIEPALGGADAVAARMAESGIVGLMALKDGRIMLERYAGGFDASKRWTSFSMAKSITSTLVGAAVKDGFIASVDDPVTRYIPELAGSAYDGVTVKQVLTMTSGVRWNEDYADPASDVARMYAIAPPPGMDATVAYLRTLPREAAPGTRWVYKTGETNLIGVLVTRATGRTLADYLGEKIWKPVGMTSDAFWMTDGGRQEIGGCCLSATLRDYARFGQFVLGGGRGVVPDDWFAAATAPQVGTGTAGYGYGYQWWTYPDGHFGANGIFGQSITIDPATHVVVVVLSNWPTASDRAASARRSALVADIIKAATTAR